MMEFLDEHAREVARRVLDEEESHRRHVVIALSGAHAYGFPSPDSDLDLKAIHIADAEALLGLGSPRDAFDRLEVIDGVEIDYTSNELRGVLAGILAGNGNYIERVLGELIPRSSAEHEQLCALVPATLSRRVHRHYRGFAANQRRAFESAERPTAKKLLYVLRTALTGTHLLRTGELRVDLTTTMESDASLTWQADLFRHYSTRALVLGGELAEVRHQLPGMVRQAQDNGNDYLAANYVRQTTSFVWLAADQPAEAARLLDRLRPTDDGPPGIELYYATANTAEVEAYAGDPVAAHDRMRAFFQRVRGSSLARVPGLMRSKLPMVSHENECFELAS